MNQVYCEKKDCCGCSACFNRCPTKAIEMRKNENGFIYPFIDTKKCIDCGLCRKVCPFINQPTFNLPVKCYCAINKNKEQLLVSSSGGAFSALATSILKEGGIVFGATKIRNEKGFSFIFKSIRTVDEIPLLQKSKYVQCDILKTYQEVERELRTGKKVLFSGVPCQIAGLKKFLLRDYKNLITVDIICHGVPNAEILNSYLHYFEKKKRIKVKDFDFRSKKKGWGPLLLKINGIAKKGKEKIFYLKTYQSSYYHLFFTSEIYRDSCYSCPFAGPKRISDITIGDYWGVQQYFPNLNVKEGCSCLLVNTMKGMVFLETHKDNLELLESKIENIQVLNHQLVKPATHTGVREKVLNIYKNSSYTEVDHYFFFHFYLPKVIRRLGSPLKKIVRFIKKSA